MNFTCCRYCVAPKRHPGCHGTCPEYIKQREEYEQFKAIRDKQNFVSQSIGLQRRYAVNKALKARKVK